MDIGCSGSSSACTMRRNLKAAASASVSSSASLTSTAGASGPKAHRVLARPSIFPSRRQPARFSMADVQHEVEILLIEDSPEDAELTIRVLKEQNLANRLVWLKNGALGLDFLFCRGAYAGRSVVEVPRLVLLDLSLPKIGGLEVLRQLK